MEHKIILFIAFMITIFLLTEFFNQNEDKKEETIERMDVMEYINKIKNNR